MLRRCGLCMIFLCLKRLMLNRMGKAMNIQFTDNSKEVSEDIKAALLRGLETCGLVAEGYAKKLAPVDTGNLRNSITHDLDDGEPAAYIGTNVEYAPYVCLGTIHMNAQPFLKPAVNDHKDEYRKILENSLKNG